TINTSPPADLSPNATRPGWSHLPGGTFRSRGLTQVPGRHVRPRPASGTYLAPSYCKSLGRRARARIWQPEWQPDAVLSSPQDVAESVSGCQNTSQPVTLRRPGEECVWKWGVCVTERQERGNGRPGPPGAGAHFVVDFLAARPGPAGLVGAPPRGPRHAQSDGHYLPPCPPRRR